MASICSLKCEQWLSAEREVEEGVRESQGERRRYEMGNVIPLEQWFSKCGI